MTHKLSPTAINLMMDCPRCFYLTYKKIWKRPKGIFPTLPSALDGMMKDYFDSYAKKGSLPDELSYNEECSGLKLFDNFELLRKWRDYRDGIIYKNREGNIMYGAIDHLLVNEESGKLIIFDFKTRGHPILENTTKYYQHQLDIYNFLFRKNGYETENYAFLLFYIPKKLKPEGKILFEPTLIKVKTNISNAENLWKQALDILNGERPHQCCDWCVKV